MSSSQLGIASAPRQMCSRVCRCSPEWFHGISCRLAEAVLSAEPGHRLCISLKGKGKVYSTNAFWCQKLLKLGWSLSFLFPLSSYFFMFVHPKWSHVRRAVPRICAQGSAAFEAPIFKALVISFWKRFSLCSQQFSPRAGECLSPWQGEGDMVASELPLCQLSVGVAKGAHHQSCWCLFTYKSSE